LPIGKVSPARVPGLDPLPEFFLRSTPA
jgi:hypothetical protein